MSDYSKHKDRLPQDTIFEIQRILHEAGLLTTLEWVKSPYAGVMSNRITLYPTDIGSNGKGTDRLYAAASAYAELINCAHALVGFGGRDRFLDHDFRQKFPFRTDLESAGHIRRKRCLCPGASPARTLFLNQKLR